jgi:hypothetical protein
MMQNYILLSSLLALTLMGCAPSKNTVKTIYHQYHNITFSPKKIQKQGKGKLIVTIIPIDAASINKETYDAAMRDGNYEKELATAIEIQRNNLNGLSNTERRIVTGRINAIDAINTLEENNLISLNTAQQLKMRIWYGKNYGKDGTEINSLSDIETFSDIFNPYKINQKYLSVFKITFENKSRVIERVNLKDFQIVSGEELLYPFEIKYFENNFDMKSEKIKNIYRMNMPEELVITPSQRVTKYLAIPAVNPQNKNLNLQMIRNSEIESFDFKVTEQTNDINYQVEGYDLVMTNLPYNPSTYYFYFALKYQNGVSFALKNRRIYVSDEMKNIPTSLYAIAIDRRNGKVKTAKRENVRFAIMDNLIYIRYNRKKRK